MRLAHSTLRARWKQWSADVKRRLNVRNEQKLPSHWKRQRSQGHGDEDWVTGSTGNHSVCTRNTTSSTKDVLSRHPPPTARLKTPTTCNLNSCAGCWPSACVWCQNEQKESEDSFTPLSSEKLPLWQSSHLWCSSVNGTTYEFNSSTQPREPAALRH